MNTPNTGSMDETMVKNIPEAPAKAPASAAAKAPAKASANAAAKTKKPIPRFWKSVMVGGVPGILIGAGAVAATSAGIYEGEEGDQGSDDLAAGSTGTSTDEVEILEAHSVNDSMSFEEAFATARAEVGPGGAFSWHGQVYGTYRADDPEWQEMSAEDRAEHSQQILSQVHAHPYTPTEHEPVITEIEDDGDDDGYDYGQFEGEDNGGAEVQPADVDDESGELDVHIVGVEQVEAGDGSTIDVGYGEVDGMDAVFADVDGDGEVDTVLIDLDGDGEPSADEIFDASGSGITVDDMQTAADFNNVETLDDQLYADMPDYTNDVDPGTLA